ncbi:Sec-independent protein translocase subunit TatA [Streptomyces sp. NPDC056982]|uniref:Sec-independent protein translocase subunit TatA n=1 Tax=Streptomyces sp. NPDC056982 TaxID=3345986 RepID=UPI00363D6D0C
MFGLSEIAIILIVVILVFGAKKLPELARSAGKSARILKAEAKAMKEERDRETAGQTPPTPQVVQGEVIAPGAAADTTSPTARTAPMSDSTQPHSQN